MVRAIEKVTAHPETYELVCSGCQTAKPREAFRRDASGRYLTQCRACSVAYSRAWREKNLERARAYAREYERERRRLYGDRLRAYDRAYQQARRDRLKAEREAASGSS